MTPKKFWAFIGVSALIFALALGAVGCGGSNGGDVVIPGDGGGEESRDHGGGTLSLSGHYILVGTLNQESELTPYISEIITDRLTLSQVENVSDPLNINFSSRDIIFIADARNLSADNPAINAFVYNALSLSGATIAAVYPNADDVNNLENMLGIHFASPNDEPVDKHYEFIAVGKRYISSDADYLTYKEGDIPYNFVYVERSSKNKGYFDASIGSFDVVYDPNPTYSDDAGVAGIVDSADSPSRNASESNNTETEQANEDEQESKEALAQRVNELISWSERLNVLAGEVASEVIRTASAFAANLAAEVKQAPDDILRLISGTHTSTSFRFDVPFAHNMYEDLLYNTNKQSRRYGLDKIVKGDWATFKVKKCGLSETRHYERYWKNFKISRSTTGKHMTYSFHSFQNNNDYYLINSSVTTQPKNLEIRAAYGPHTTGDELEYSSTYHYALILGCTRKLTLDIWPGNNQSVKNIKIIPSLTVNREHSYSDTDSWNIGGGVSFGGGRMGGDTPAGFGNIDASFNFGISHQSTRQWTASDYELVPKPRITENGISLAEWDIDVQAPYYRCREGWTQLSTAARESVTLEGESIWLVPPEAAYTFDFTTRMSFQHGFMWARELLLGLFAQRYDCTFQHIGYNEKLTFARPPHAALSDVVTHGTNEGKMYTAKIYTGNSWEAESDSYWLELMETSGEASMGGNFTYTVAPNYTGEQRRGRITITTGRDKINLVFDQSAYPAEAKP